jgi:hypothetical protein
MTTNGSMSAAEDYGFDVVGFIHLRQVLTAAEVAACSQSIVAAGDGPLPLSNDSFRTLQEHPVLQNYLEALCGAGFVMDEPPSLIPEGAADRVPLDAGDPEKNRRLRYVSHGDTRISHGVRVV